MEQERMDLKSGFVEGMKELYKIDPKYADRYFDLNEKHVHHKMDMEKTTAENERKDFRLRWWVILATRLVFACLAAWSFYLGHTGAGYSLSGGLASSFLPQAYQSWLSYRKKIPPVKNPDP